MIAARYSKELQLLTPANNVKYTGGEVKSQCTSQTIIYIRTLKRDVVNKVSFIMFLYIYMNRFKSEKEDVGTTEQNHYSTLPFVLMCMHSMDNFPRHH